MRTLSQSISLRFNSTSTSLARHGTTAQLQTHNFISTKFRFQDIDTPNAVYTIVCAHSDPTSSIAVSSASTSPGRHGTTAAPRVTKCRSKRSSRTGFTLNNKQKLNHRNQETKP